MSAYSNRTNRRRAEIGHYQPASGYVYHDVTRTADLAAAYNPVSVARMAHPDRDEQAAGTRSIVNHLRGRS